MNWMTLPFRRFADFKGRSRRMEYWMFALLLFIVYAVLFMVMFGTGFSFASLGDAAQRGPTAIYGSFFAGTGLLLVVWWLVTLIPTVAVGVRRLHDRNMSGWWYLGLVVASLIPRIGFIASIAMLVLFLLPGTPGPNRFGPDPKDPLATDVFA